MYKNQLQELAQRSCFNLPSYTCIREGPDHAPRFRSIVNFNGETFESPHYFSTLRQAEHAAAEVALCSLSSCSPSHFLAAKIFDETGVYKNLLQEIAQRVSSPLPRYTTFRSGLGHLPIFTGTVELAGITFTGEPAKNKKQAEKNAAMAAWSCLKQLTQLDASSSSEPENNDEQEQIRIAWALLNYRLKEKMVVTKSGDTTLRFQKKFPISYPSRPLSPQRPLAAASKILPLICSKTSPQNKLRPDNPAPSSQPPSLTHSVPPLGSMPRSQSPVTETHIIRPHKFPAVGAAHYVPVQHFRMPCQGIAPPVTIRTAEIKQPRPMQLAPPVCVRQAVPVFAAPPVRKEDSPSAPASTTINNTAGQIKETGSKTSSTLNESETVKGLEQLRI